MAERSAVETMTRFEELFATENTPYLPWRSSDGRQRFLFEKLCRIRTRARRLVRAAELNGESVEKYEAIAGEIEREMFRAVEAWEPTTREMV
jgi:hypothetical protein